MLLFNVRKLGSSDIHWDTLTIFYVRRVLRHAKIVPDKKKNWVLVVFFFLFFLRHGTNQCSHGLFFIFTFAYTQEIDKRMPIKIKKIQRKGLGKVNSMNCRLLHVM